MNVGRGHTNTRPIAFLWLRRSDTHDHKDTHNQRVEGSQWEEAMASKGPWGFIVVVERGGHKNHKQAIWIEYPFDTQQCDAIFGSHNNRLFFCCWIAKRVCVCVCHKNHFQRKYWPLCAHASQWAILAEVKTFFVVFFRASKISFGIHDFFGAPVRRFLLFWVSSFFFRFFSGALLCPLECVSHAFPPKFLPLSWVAPGGASHPSTV